eukprot:scaffold2.g7186.t1
MQLLDATSVLRWLAVFLLARLLCWAALSRWAERRTCNAKDPAHRDERKLREEAYTTGLCLFLMAFSLRVLHAHNGGCGLGGTATCFAGWPAHPPDCTAHQYVAAEVAYYLQILLKPVLRYGPRDGRDMMLHHAATLVLILVSFSFNLTRIGILVLAVYSFSNPFLHFAKAVKQLELSTTPAFLLFGGVFFLTRVVLVPLTVLRASLLESRRDVPHLVDDYWPVYAGCNALLLALYGLQLVWMRGIVRVLARGLRQGSAAAAALTANLDPARRYGSAGGGGSAPATPVKARSARLVADSARSPPASFPFRKKEE